MSFLRVKKLLPLATLPVKGSQYAAGYDLHSAEQTTVPARGRKLISIGIAIAVPSGNYGRIAPRSGLAVKNGIDVGAGVVDEDYRGEVKVLLFNFSDQEFCIEVGDRIAQLIIEKITMTEVQECQSLDDTTRGSDGFGSTGVAMKEQQQ